MGPLSDRPPNAGTSNGPEFGELLTVGLDFRGTIVSAPKISSDRRGETRASLEDPRLGEPLGCVGCQDVGEVALVSSATWLEAEPTRAYSSWGYKAEWCRPGLEDPRCLRARLTTFGHWIV